MELAPASGNDATGRLNIAAVLTAGIPFNRAKTFAHHRVSAVVKPKFELLQRSFILLFTARFLGLHVKGKYHETPSVCVYLFRIHHF